LQIASVLFYSRGMTKTNPESDANSRSDCPVTCVLDILGDKWTLVVVRDLLIGKHRYNEFMESPEGIPSNILADRLKRLESAGIVKRDQYQERPPRSEYFLTTKGADLQPVLFAMVEWGRRYLPCSSYPEKPYQPEIRD
jgi:DNA-binding HxlR family transcriptional regulator